jgi:hypothetical protein
MDIKTYNPSEQVDIAVDLRVLPPPLPKILNLRQLLEVAPAPPPQIIEGILHQACKMILGGTSKSNKSWCLLDLAVSVASGQKWWGRQCTKIPVIYINFELHDWAIMQRLNALLTLNDTFSASLCSISPIMADSRKVKDRQCSSGYNAFSRKLPKIAHWLRVPPPAPNLTGRAAMSWVVAGRKRTPNSCSVTIWRKT